MQNKPSPHLQVHVKLDNKQHKNTIGLVYMNEMNIEYTVNGVRGTSLPGRDAVVIFHRRRGTSVSAQNVSC